MQSTPLDLSFKKIRIMYFKTAYHSVMNTSIRTVLNFPNRSILYRSASCVRHLLKINLYTLPHCLMASALVNKLVSHFILGYEGSNIHRNDQGRGGGAHPCHHKSINLLLKVRSLVGGGGGLNSWIRHCVHLFIHLFNQYKTV